VSAIVVLLNNDAVAERGLLRHLVAPGGRRWVRVGDDAAPPGVDPVIVLNSTGNQVTRSGNGRVRDRRARTLLAEAARAPRALRRRRQVDRTATVPRAVRAALLVPDSGWSR
jgi:hypothetical protein